MNPDQVLEIANRFVNLKLKRSLPLIEVKKWHKNAYEWNVIFETQDASGKAFVGPTIVVVDARTAEARFF